MYFNITRVTEIIFSFALHFLVENILEQNVQTIFTARQFPPTYTARIARQSSVTTDPSIMINNTAAFYFETFNSLTAAWTVLTETSYRNDTVPGNDCFDISSHSSVASHQFNLLKTYNNYNVPPSKTSIKIGRHDDLSTKKYETRDRRQETGDRRDIDSNDL